MTTLTVGQCLAYSNNEYVVSVVSLDVLENKITYTLLGMNAPTSSNLLATSLRFYQVTDKTLSLDELRARRLVVQSVIDQRHEKQLSEENARIAANEQESNNPDNVGLVTAAVESNSTKLAAKNIRILLKKHFPGVKFSVRMRDYNAIYLSWTDGPTKAAVEAITDKFEEGQFNGMEDYYEYSSTTFNSVYGGVKYLFCTRSHSDELIAEAIAKLRSRFGENAVPVDITAEQYRKGELWNSNLNCFANGIQAEINKQVAGIDKSKR